MRNLKKILALVLAMVMTLSVMSVAGAFTDDEKIGETYAPATTVLSGLKVFQGRPDGSFDPQGSITRAEVAAIIYRIATGDVDNKQVSIYADYNKFPDVTNDKWFAGYVNYCANAEYVKGRPDGKFDPDATVTGYEALAMILRAIGYDANDEFTGPNWAVNTASIANQRGITKNVNEGTLNTAASREVVAELLFRTVLVDTVRYEPAFGYKQNETSLGNQVFGLHYFEDVVMANEYADLDDSEALPEGKTQIGETVYNCSTELTDIGESRYGWAAKKDVLYIADTGYNTVFQTGEATDISTAAKFAKVTGMADDAEHFINFEDTTDIKYETDILIVYSLNGVDYTKIKADAKLTAEQYAEIKSIFNDDDYADGWVVVGTKFDIDTAEEKDISNDMTFKAFVKEYLTDVTKSSTIVNGSVNGDWLKVVDNDGDGKAEYVFKTEFVMEEVAGVSKKGVLSFTGSSTTFGGSKDYPYVTSEEKLSYGDIILYTIIDGVAYVELAPNFTGEVDKYTYKTETLTVEGEDYTESGIEENTNYYNSLVDAEKETEYTYYQDFFGHIRIFTLPANTTGELVLLTDAFFKTDRKENTYAVIAYLDEALGDYDVKDNKAEYIDDANHDNGWGLLNDFDTYTGYNEPESLTNLARYTKDGDVLTLTNAKTYTYGKKGQVTGIATDYVDLDEQTFKAGETDFDGYYAFQTYDATKYGLTFDHVDNGQVKVQANKNTVFYYVSRDGRGNAVVDNVIVGYKNTVAVTGENTILSMYAVAKNVWNDAKDDPYWVAEAIVIETEEPVASISKDVALVYNVLNKTYKDYAGVEALDSNGEAADLSVISLNGNDYNKFENSDIVNPWFYTNSVDKSGDSYIRQITKNYGAYGIYAAVLDRVNYLADDYVKAIGGKTISLNEETLKVYDVVEKATYNALDDDDGDLSLKTGEAYIFYTVKGEAIYAIHVPERAVRDVAAITVLFDAIVEDAVPGKTNAEDMLNIKTVWTAAEIAEARKLADELAAGDSKTDAEWAAKLDARADLDEAKNTAIAYLNDDYVPGCVALPGVEAEDLEAVVAEVVAEIEKMTDKDAVAAYVKNDNVNHVYGDGVLKIWTKVLALQEATGTEVADVDALTDALENDDITTITLTADIELDAQITVPAGKTLNGNGKTITAEGYKGTDSTKNGGILVSGGTVKNLTVVGPDSNIGWDNGEYGIKVYGEATLEDVTVTGANAGIQIAANTTLKGTIDVSGNEFGGIEVKDNAVLTIDKDATLVNSTEKADAPTIWKDSENAGTVKGGDLTSKLLKVDETIKQYYYLNAANAQ